MVSTNRKKIPVPSPQDVPILRFVCQINVLHLCQSQKYILSNTRKRHPGRRTNQHPQRTMQHHTASPCFLSLLRTLKHNTKQIRGTSRWVDDYQIREIIAKKRMDNSVNSSMEKDDIAYSCIIPTYSNYVSKRRLLYTQS